MFQKGVEPSSSGVFQDLEPRSHNPDQQLRGEDSPFQEVAVFPTSTVARLKPQTGWSMVQSTFFICHAGNHANNFHTSKTSSSHSLQIFHH